MAKNQHLSRLKPSNKLNVKCVVFLTTWIPGYISMKTGYTIFAAHQNIKYIFWGESKIWKKKKTLFHVQNTKLWANFERFSFTHFWATKWYKKITKKKFDTSICNVIINNLKRKDIDFLPTPLLPKSYRW